MYAGRDFADTDTGESQIFVFDFSGRLFDYDSLTAATWTCEVSAGTDANAQSHIDGAAVIDGTKVRQRVSGALQPGVIYTLTCTVQTLKGDRLSMWARVACVEPA